MADLPLTLEPSLAGSLARALDVEGKIPRALEALGPISNRDVILVGSGPAEAVRLTEAGARVVRVDQLSGGPWDVPSASADVVVSAWSGFRGAEPAEIVEAERVLRPGGRLLVIHDYGRDDVSRLRGDLPEYGVWTHRNGPFLDAGFRIRVIHCFWTFASIDDARAFLGGVFGEQGAQLAAGLKRPRLSYNVAIYHRTKGQSEGLGDVS